MTASLVVRGLCKRFGGFVAARDVDFDLAPGELRGLIGPNGAGKSTFINLLSGELTADCGSIRFDGREIVATPVHKRVRAGLARSYQITSVLPGFTVLQNVMLATRARQGQGRARLWECRPNSAMVDAARQALVAVDLAGHDSVLVDHMAYGARRQVEMAMVIALNPKVMLLDEPLAGMSGQEAGAMIRLLRRIKGQFGIVLVEHDMDAVFALADRITVIAAGHPVITGAPAEVRTSNEVQRLYLGVQDEIS